MMRQQEDQESKVFYELSALILNILRSPPVSINFSEEVSVATDDGSSSAAAAAAARRRRDGVMQQITPAGFASLLLGISLALMLCGSLTFFIGFMLMPWVIGMAMIFYVIGFVSSLSMIGRSILYPSPTPPSSPTKNCSSWRAF